MWLVHQAIKVRWVSLVNILLNRGIYPEFLGSAATVQNLLHDHRQYRICGKSWRISEEVLF